LIIFLMVQDTFNDRNLISFELFAFTLTNLS
jgi:hypothetical protein